MSKTNTELIDILKEDVHDALSDSFLESLGMEDGFKKMHTLLHKNFEQKVLSRKEYKELDNNYLEDIVIPYLCSKYFDGSSIRASYQGYPFMPMRLSSFEGRSLDYIRGTIVSSLINNSAENYFEIRHAKKLALLGYKLKKDKTLVVYGKHGPGLGFSNQGGKIFETPSEILDVNIRDATYGLSAAMASSYWSFNQGASLEGLIVMGSLIFGLASFLASDIRYFFLERKISALEKDMDKERQ